MIQSGHAARRTSPVRKKVVATQRAVSVSPVLSVRKSFLPTELPTFPNGTKPRIPLYKHQAKGIKILVRKLQQLGYWGLLDDCGMGKSAQCIYALRDLLYAKTIEKIVIVCKPDLVYNWLEELKTHAPELPVQVLAGKVPTKRVLQRTAVVYIVTYQLIAQPPRASKHTLVSVFTGVAQRVNFDTMRLVALLMRYKCALACDESHWLRTQTARSTDTLCSVRDLARCRLILTATLEAETPLDAWSQMFFLDGGRTLGKSWEAFRDRYAISETVPYRTRFGTRYKLKQVAWQNINELREMIRSVTTRRLKTECTDLPPQIFKHRQCTAEGSQLTLMRTLRTALQGTVSAMPGTSLVLTPGTPLAVKLHAFLRAAAMPCTVEKSIVASVKYAALLEVLQETTEQVIVWCTHRDVTRAVKRQLKQDKHSAVLVYGGIERTLRDARLQEFKKGNARLLVCTGNALREGHNLQNAAHCVQFQIPWSLLTLTQSAARVHRIGQTKTVVQENFVLKQSLDTYQLNRLKGKARVIHHTSAQGSKDVVVLHKEEFLDALNSW